MTVTNRGKRYPNTIAAYNAGYEAGAKAESERQTVSTTGSEPESDGPAPLTVDDIRAGKYSDDELIARKSEVDALMEGQP